MSRNHDLERQLRKKSNDLLSGNENPDLTAVLIKEFHGLKAAYILNAIPEQGCDLYRVLIPPDKVATIEIPRGARNQGPATVEIDNIEDFTVRFPELMRRRREMLRAIKDLTNSEGLEM